MLRFILSTSYVKPHFEVYKPACRCSLCKKENAMGPHRHDRTESFRWFLYLLGVSKGNHENIRNLWSYGPRPIFKTTMSVNRFEIIRCHLRFDSIDTRKERRARDKFAPFRELWNFFESKCRENYKPSAEVCIDKQLIPFRGRCSFGQYMPSKPEFNVDLLVSCQLRENCCFTINIFNKSVVFYIKTTGSPRTYFMQKCLQNILCI